MFKYLVTLLLATTTAFGATKALQGDTWKSNNLLLTWTPPSVSDTIVGIAATQTLTNKTLTSPTISGGTISGTTINVTDNGFTLRDNVDPSKRVAFELSSITSATTHTFFFPNNGSTTLVDTGFAQTLLNKTLTSPIINGGVVSSATVSGSTIEVFDNAITFRDNVDSTKRVAFELSNITTGNTRTLFLPDNGGTTLVDTGFSQTLTNKSIDADTNILTNIENADIKSGAAIALNKLAAVQTSRALISDSSGVVSSSAVTSTELGYLTGVTSKPATLTGSETLTNKTVSGGSIVAPTIIVNDNDFVIRDGSITSKNLQFQLSDISVATTRTMTIPDADFTAVGTSTTQTLTNKSFNFLNMVHQGSAPSAPAAGYSNFYTPNSTGLFTYQNSGGTLYSMVEEEVGTWTPVVSGSTTGGSYNYASRTGRYIRHRKRVFFDFDIRMGTHGVSATGDLRIAGLPFTSASTILMGTINYGYIGTWGASVVWVGGSVNPSSTYFDVTQRTGAGVTTSYTGAIVSPVSGTIMIGHGSYELP